MTKKMLVLFVLVLAGLPATTEAQSRSSRYYEVRDAIYGRGYDRGYPARQSRGNYDPYYDQLIRLPGNLVACQMDFDSGRVVGCHPLVKTVEFLEEHGYAHQNRNELVGTSRAHDNKLLFCPFDDTNRRLGTLEAGALGGAGGAGIGGAVDGRRGAAIGGVAGVIVGGIIASRNTHDGCLKIVGGVAKTTEIQQEASPVSYMEQATQPITDSEARDESHGSAFRSGPHPLTNSSRVYVDVYDGDRKPENFVGSMESGDSLDLARPRNRYRGWAQVPNEKGSFDAEELGIEVGPTGWTFIEPQVARGRS